MAICRKYRIGNDYARNFADVVENGIVLCGVCKTACILRQSGFHRVGQGRVSVRNFADIVESDIVPREVRKGVECMRI